MLAQVVFQCNLVKKDELKTSSNGKSYLRITVAKNYPQKISEDEYENIGIFENLTLFGKQAELFDASDIPLGSPLLVAGNLNGRVQPAYTAKDGTGYPEQNIEQIFVTEIGAIIGQGRTVAVTLGNYEQKPTKSASKKPSKIKEDDLDDIFA